MGAPKVSARPAVSSETGLGKDLLPSYHGVGSIQLLKGGQMERMFLPGFC